MKIEKIIDGLYKVDTKLDLVQLRKTADIMHGIITQNFKSNLDFDYTGSNSTQTTKLFAQYNFLMYLLPGIHELYFTISNVFRACLKDHYGSTKNNKFFIQSWMNYYKKGEFIDWHSHSPKDVGGWHGFLCLDTEPDSYTSYRWPKDPKRKNLIIDVPSKNGSIIIGRSNGDEHKSSVWEFENKSRITIAFDIDPLDAYITPNWTTNFDNNNFLLPPMLINHWIPI